MENSQGLHCSHYIGRGNWATRFDPDNALSLCYGCHRIVGSDPTEHTRILLAKIGQKRYNELRRRSQDLRGLGNTYRRTKGKGDIAKYFRGQIEPIRKGEQEEVERWM